MEMQKIIKVLVIHGPNLNMLGKREPDIYGTLTLDDINSRIKTKSDTLNLLVETFQSNYEGAIVEKLHDATDKINGLIINPAAYTHTSVSIRDAIIPLSIPVIEIHLSNIHKREHFRHKSLIADIVTARISGCGHHGYILALEAIFKMITDK